MSMPTISPHIGGIDRNQALHSIIGSIALAEAALSHILNADGEKLQLAVSMTDERHQNFSNAYEDSDEIGAQQAALDDLIKANESVNDTIFHVKNMETALQGKLGTVLDFMQSKKIESYTYIDEDDTSELSAREKDTVGIPVWVETSPGSNVFEPRGGFTVSVTKVADRYNARISPVDAPSEAKAEQPSDTVAAVTNSNGVAEFRLPPGAYKIQVVDPADAGFDLPSPVYSLRVTEQDYYIDGINRQSFSYVPIQWTE
jgi:hypothetical protein